MTANVAKKENDSATGNPSARYHLGGELQGSQVDRKLRHEGDGDPKS